MRGADEQTGALFSYLSPEALAPPDHSLRSIRPLVNTAVLSGWPKAARCGVRTADRLLAVCDAGHIAPDLESDVARSTILGGSQAMAGAMLEFG